MFINTKLRLPSPILSSASCPSPSLSLTTLILFSFEDMLMDSNDGDCEKSPAV